MQWNSGKNAGFTSGEPWMMVNPNCTEINAEEQLKDENSVFRFYQQLLKIRKEYIDIIRDGKFNLIDKNNKNIFAYERTLGEKTLLVLCSLSPKKASVKLNAKYLNKSRKLIVSNTDCAPELSNKTVLSPCQCAVYIM